jgi:hypothetical protein
MRFQMPLLAVEGDEVLRFGQGMDDFQFFLAGMARNMKVGKPFVETLPRLSG